MAPERGTPGYRAASQHTSGLKPQNGLVLALSVENPNALWGLFIYKDFRLSQGDETAPFSSKENRLLSVEDRKQHGDLYPITLEQCFLLEGEGRYLTMADHLATHYGRPDRAEGWARSLEATKWKENYVSGFFDVNRQKRIQDWWLLLNPARDGEVGINLVHVSSAYEPLEILESVDLLSQINEAVRAARATPQTPCSSTVELVRWANRLIHRTMRTLRTAPNQCK